MKHLAGVLTHFWKRWRSEYLNELRGIQKSLATVDQVNGGGGGGGGGGEGRMNFELSYLITSLNITS